MVEKVQDVKSEHSISGTPYNPTRPSTSSSVGLSEARRDPSSSASPSRREVFDATLAGAREGVLLPHLRSDPSPSKAYRPPAHSLNEFRQQEGGQREARLKEIWQKLAEARSGKGKEPAPLLKPVRQMAAGVGTVTSIFNREKAERLQDVYDNELSHQCGNSRDSTHAHGPKPPIPWKDFYRYAEAKEVGELSTISHFGAFAYLIGIPYRVMARISR
jgi:hypothetical protein